MKNFRLRIPGMLSILAILLFTVSCQKESETTNFLPADNQPNPMALKSINLDNIDYCGTPSVETLVAGQNIDAGTVTVGNDENYVYVTYTSSNGYLITQTHLYVGPKSGVPVNNAGNPRIGLFPYGESFASPVQTVTYRISLEELPECYVVAAHAVVVKYQGNVIVDQQTAWGNGTRFVNRGSWAMYFEYCTQTCEIPEDPETWTETAYAFGAINATCFLDLGFSRWGWTNSISEGEYSFEIWAGAGQCDLSKGTHVGYLNISYYNGTATITYNLFNDYLMLQNHLYVGSNQVPIKNGKPTVAPGQYPIVVDNLSTTTTTYTISNLSGDIYVIAHAVIEFRVS